MTGDERVEALAEVIRSVTDLWDEPLDEVHDVPQIVNAILASPALRDLLASERAKALRDARAELGEALWRFRDSERAYGNRNRAAALAALANWNDGAGYAIDREVQP